jgi:hypothetical protein
VSICNKLLLKNYDFNFNVCERCSNWFVENNYLDEKNQGKGGRNGKMHALRMGCTMES